MLQRCLPLLLLLILVPGAAISGRLSAQEAPPGPTVCELSIDPVSGPFALTVGRFQLLLPAGFTFRWALTNTEAGGPGARLCVVQFNAELVISDIDGREVSRRATELAPNLLFNQIVASARLVSCFGTDVVWVSGPGPGPAGFPSVSLPAGTFSFRAAPSGSAHATTICYLEGHSEVRLTRACAEQGRTVLRPTAAPVLDQVVASAVCPLPSPTPPAAFSSQVLGASQGLITPPNTGDGGLSRRR